MQVSINILTFNPGMFISYLYKSWNNPCPDDTKSSVEDLYWCQDLAEEHDVGYGVKRVVERIWNESRVINSRSSVEKKETIKEKQWGTESLVPCTPLPLPKMKSRAVMLTKIQEKPRNWTRLYTNRNTVFWLINPETFERKKRSALTSLLFRDVAADKT